MELPEKISKLNHDLRNALSVLYSQAQLLELLLEGKSGEAHDTAKEITKAITDMEQLLKQRVDDVRSSL